MSGISQVFCAQICLGLKKELGARTTGTIQQPTGGIRELLEVYGPHLHENREAMERVYQGNGSFVELGGQWFEPNRAIEARRLELEFFRKTGSIQKFHDQQQAATI